MKMSYIYKIINIITKDFYIGSTNNWTKRKQEHFRKAEQGIHPNYKLNIAFKKYGKDNFKFEVIEECLLKNKLKIEQLYLNNLQPKYNISLHSSAPMDGRKHSKQTMDKFKKRKIIKGSDHYMYGKKWTKEFKIKMIQLKLNKKFKHTDETKSKMSKISKRLKRHLDLLPFIEKSKKPLKDNMNNNFKSLVDAAKYWKISVSSVCDILKGRTKKTKNGIVFYYA